MRATSSIPGLVLALSLFASTAATAQVTIYRCTDDQGRLTVRDSPCAKDQQQQTREMLRPRDPPTRPAPATPVPPLPTAAAPTTQIVVVTPPRPSYECVRADGTTYLSDSSAGDLRWEPGWTLGYPAGPHRHGGHHAGLPRVARPRTLDGRLRAPTQLQPPGLVFGNVGRPTPRPDRDGPGAPRHPPTIGIVAAPGAWVRDQCYALPPQETCARLRDQHHALGRRYNSALQSERTLLSQQQRSLDARLASECGGD